FSATNKWVYLWAEDAASSWSVDSDGFATVSIYIRAHNAELGNLTSRLTPDWALSSKLIERGSAEDYVEYEFSIICNPADLFGVGAGLSVTAQDGSAFSCNAAIIGAAPITPIDAASPFSVELLPGNLEQEPIAYRSVNGKGEYIDASQFELVGAESKTMPIPSVSISSLTPKVGDTLTATLPEGVTGTYQWCRIVNGVTSSIYGAKSATYTVTDADLGAKLKVKAIGTGNYTGFVFSRTTAEVEPGANFTIQFKNPDAQYLGTLNVATTPVDARNTATYQWYIVDAQGNETLIEDATKAYYKIQDAGVGCAIKVVATGSGAYYGATSAVSQVVPNPTISRVSLSLTVPSFGKTASVTTVPTLAKATATYQWTIMLQNVL
ncbi:MAG: hypothetical protein HUK22_05670, partial [Thermoguttaceae bacterium]|nr:hypothetical protein [Thermoguttaceae bacterium]